jgi:outer membrane receptor protein involved in Fe transport
MSKRYKNANGQTDIFKYEATLDNDKEFFNKREVFGTILNARYYIGDKNYFSSITSYFNNIADSRFDGDGSAAPAIDMAERVRAKQFMEELRYNFSYGNRFTGIAGASYWREDVNHKYTFRPDEQYMVYIFLEGMADYLGLPKGAADAMVLGNGMPELQGEIISQSIQGLNFPLPSNHVEENYTQAVNSAYDLFLDASYKIIYRLSITAGIRATFENFSITNCAYHAAGDRSTLGMLLGTFPNFFFKPVDNPKRDEAFSAFTWRAGLKYDINDRSNVYAGYSKGRRPNVLQYDSEGKYDVIDAETLHSFDAGYRFVSYRFMFDASLYYQKYHNFQSWKWEGMNYLQENIDNATSYGAEISVRYLLNSYLNVFGNYAYAFTTFDDKDNRDRPQLNAGNSFRLTPKNSFLLGFTTGCDVSSNMRIMLTPTYSWKSHIFFEDSNDAGIEQDAYGLLNANLSLCFKEQGLTVSVFGSNLAGEKYLIGAGNMGAMFGVPTFVPGAPRMLGAKLTWKFNK